MDCGLKRNCTLVVVLTDESLRSFLDSEVQEAQTTVKESYLANMVQAVLSIQITVKPAKGRMKLLYME